ncbi:hypothetical protein G7Z17_g998 [Cylindrodendrum hubeiense]|uniref:Uncharacterized protein n=1 Tax=Cylindrodendrum hubeiense TaxID=595255 RepID=A0A9P5HLN3_9HYPO|nr:hypothetical protein G7Z17_g998 [Cylindrodendrum hubeiense]
MLQVIEDNNTQVKQIYQEQKERDLLQNLGSNYEDNKNFNPKKVQGTCEWLFGDKKFREWRDKDSSSLLWVSAGPGCGKSVLSRALVDERRLSTNITSTICYFFFKDGDERRNRSNHALCAILHQVFSQDTSGNLIEAALRRERFHRLPENFSELWRILMECTLSPDFGETVCILDALDECDKESRGQLINALRDFYCKQNGRSNSASKLKFLVTSRPYDDLEAYFGKFGTTTYLRFDGDEKSDEIRNEINLVIDHRMDEVAGNFADADRRTISERLKNMKNRTYLWLYLIFNTIEENLSLYRKRSSIERLLSDIPSQVSEAYEKILSRSQDQALSEMLLEIILAAKRPLTLEEANVALTLASQEERPESLGALTSELWPKENFQSTIQNLCGLFISVYDSKLSFIHQTAREFLIHPERQGKWQGRLNVPKSHSTTSKLCLHYLLLPDLPEGKEWPYQDRESSPELEIASLKSQDDEVEIVVYEDSDDIPFEADLHLASYIGNNLVAQDILLEDHGDVNMQERYYGTAILIAAEGGHREVVRMLLDHDVNIEFEGRPGGTALAQASRGGHKEIVQMLLDKGANVNSQNERYGTPLYGASNSGWNEIVQLLFDKGADINLMGGYFTTPLRAADAHDHRVVFDILLDRGADIDDIRGDYDTLLYSAAEEGEKETVQMPLEKGANINMIGGRRGTALHAAIVAGKDEIFQVLLDRDADVRISHPSYGTALQAAAAVGKEEAFRILLDRGADINARGGSFVTAFRAAVWQGNKAIIQMLRDQGAEDVDSHSSE